MLTAEKLKEFAQNTLKSKTATGEERAEAEKAIRRVTNHAEISKGRPKRPRRKDYESEEAHYQALKDYRTVLDRAAVVREASKILDDRSSSVYLRRKAREALYGPDPEPEPVKTAESKSSDKPQRSSLSTNELAEEKARAQVFLDWIDKNGLPAEPPMRQPDPPTVAKPPKPVDPALYCEFCRTTFQVCGCHAIACPLCLRPKANCYPPCPFARIR